MAEAREARAYAMRNQQGSNWFDHDGSSVTSSTQAPAPVTEPPVTPPEKNGADPPVGRTQMIKPVCDSNQWFKYDGASGSSPKKEVPGQPASDWYADGTAPTDDNKKESKPRVMTSEGESYCRRDKAGSSDAWFSHEHGKEPAPQGAAGPRVTSEEGCDNATRMRGESENWFSHDPSGEANEPVHVSRGRGIKPHSSEMHHVFHHSDDAGK